MSGALKGVLKIVAGVLVITAAQLFFHWPSALGMGLSALWGIAVGLKSV